MSTTPKTDPGAGSRDPVGTGAHREQTSSRALCFSMAPSSQSERRGDFRSTAGKHKSSPSARILFHNFRESVNSIACRRLCICVLNTVTSLAPPPRSSPRGAGGADCRNKELDLVLGYQVLTRFQTVDFRLPWRRRKRDTGTPRVPERKFRRD